MAERTEEKYLITYSEYSIIANRIKALMQPDLNGDSGKYSISSLYFDDPFDTALAEKEDGNAVHIKYRIRTYNGSGKTIKLERKTKRGVVTEKYSVTLTENELKALISGEQINEDSKAFGLASEIRSKSFRPAITVRYDREAYIMPSLGIRVTFDMIVDALPAEIGSLFGDTRTAIPAIPRDKIIMEIKYSDRCPSFIRKAHSGFGMQQSVSKYALARTAPNN